MTRLRREYCEEAGQTSTAHTVTPGVYLDGAPAPNLNATEE